MQTAPPPPALGWHILVFGRTVEIYAEDTARFDRLARRLRPQGVRVLAMCRGHRQGVPYAYMRLYRGPERGAATGS